MCKVVKYWFACHHGFCLRHSKCGGTKHKNTRCGLTTACKSESYLNFVFAVSCGPCQHQVFESAWNHKLKLAEAFLNKLKEKGLPGVREVGALIEQLKEQFNTATWGTRTLFPHAHKECTVRVSLGHFEKTPSPLSREVLPEDIPEPSEIVGSDHPDYDYDWDYVASTDPIHPVDTNYAHPLDEVDPSWMLNHLSPEEFEQSGDGIGFDAGEADLAWAGSLEEADTGSTQWGDATTYWTPEATGLARLNMDSVLAPEKSTRGTMLNPQSEACMHNEHLLSERVDIVIQYFWILISGSDPSEYPSQFAMSPFDQEIDNVFEILRISTPPSDHETPQTGMLTPPPTPPRPVTERVCDSNSTAASPPAPLKDPTSLFPVGVESQSLTSPSQLAQTPTPNPTSSFHDKWRRHVSSTVKVDRAKFNKELLLLSRCEIKNVKGAHGRFVLDPQLPRDGDKNGWWK
ncbi:hypothetical protein N0V86_009293 [Didymella sp. IMI 355093]|nr:hypothetical protein N0V86_009293 [Didymella sp. IMI 355093]